VRQLQPLVRRRADRLWVTLVWLALLVLDELTKGCAEVVLPGWPPLSTSRGSKNSRATGTKTFELLVGEDAGPPLKVRVLKPAHGGEKYELKLALLGL